MNTVLPSLAGVQRPHPLVARAAQVLMMLLCVFWLVGAQAQSTASEDRQTRSFVDSVGSSLYFLAWPTATYRGVTYDGATKRPNGVDLQITLYGRSAFDDSSLWVELVLQVRNGSVSGIRWGRHNAILARPGETMIALGETLDQLSREYQRSNATRDIESTPLVPPPPRATVPQPPPSAPVSYTAICLANPTDGSMAYTMPWSGQREERTLKPKEARMYWDVRPGAEFTVTFDNSYGDGYTPGTVVLSGKLLQAAPEACADAEPYNFMTEKQSIGIWPVSWKAGFPHPFAPTLVTGAKPNDYQCAAGHKWLDPADNSYLSCIPASQGRIGIRYEVKNELDYPFILTVRSQGPAARAGVTERVWLMSVNGISTYKKALAEVETMLNGATGSTVTFGIAVPEGQTRYVTMTRD